MRDPNQCSPRRTGHGLRLLPGCGKGPGRVCMRAPAEHDIAQDDGDRRIAGGLNQVLTARTRVDHRVWPALGKLLCSQIQYHMRALL